MKAIKQFFATDQKSWSLLLVRLALGIVILPHGMQKALGMFGGYGFSGTVGFFESMGIPLILAVLVILAEFAGSIGILLGLATRFMAASLFISMTGAMFLGGHIHNGFFMNWFGMQKGEGIEYFILVLGMALALVVGGSGRYAVDNCISKKLK
ncbi:DoxX family protein [Microbacter margulisiae]|uniref:Putative oxidoreductase n=1 Tax=Microbacter margulisiae TaxID=1350067 RepID=A0A7W5DP00_9PORP|nr:DoxX family protein [Microbacter margulisiae]MBB3186135.1 putative oxidoreductase [Microbacter margulisiae]